MRKLCLTLVLALAFVVPAFAEMGARLNFVGPKSVYAKVGLQSGDAVIDIDGVAPASAGEVGAAIYEKRADGKKHTIRIIRAGKKVTLKF